MIELSNVTVNYPYSEESALKQVNLSLPRGSIGVVLGGNDSGKSTLLNLLSGLAQTMYNASFEGSYTVKGTVSAALQDSDIFLMPTVDEELHFSLYGKKQAWVRKEISRTAEELRLAGLIKRQIHSLSGGERQRVALAAAFIASKDVILLDDPLSQMDAESANSIVKLLKKMADEGKTILVASNRSYPYDETADYYFLLDQGQLVWQGSPASFKNMREKALSVGVDVNGKVFNSSENACGLNQSEEKPQSNQPVLEIKNLHYGYDQGFQLSSINLTVNKGERIVITGENGSGKTTLLKMAAGILKPRSGDVLISGQSILKMSIAEATANSGFLFQNPDHQLFHSRIDKEIMWGLTKRGLNKEEAQSRLNKWLNLLSLEKYADQHPYSLSKTYRQWVALASVMANEPSLLLLDEPTFGLDTAASKRFADIINEAAAAGTTVLMITHQSALADYCADKRYVMSKGMLTGQ